MRHSNKVLVFAASTFVFANYSPASNSDAVTASQSSGYEQIAVRNLFGLRPLAPVEVKPPPEEPLPKITLTVITTIFQSKRVVLKIEPPAKSKEPGKDESYILCEGERHGDIEVIAIDEISGTVKVNHRGMIQTLDWANNEARPASTPANPPRHFPNLPPAAGLRSTAIDHPAESPNPGAPASGQLTSEESALLIELQRDKFLREGDSRAKLLPPTKLSAPKPGPEQGQPSP